MTGFTINAIADNRQIQDIVVNPAVAEKIPGSAAASVQPQKQPSIYGELPQIPNQDAVEEINFDFNEGIRILFPHNGKAYHVTFTDLDTGIILYSNDKERVHGTGLIWNHMPWGVEDETGDKPLLERIDLIKDADFFIGLSPGLSWLAWGCKDPVVMISGFTHPTNEFATPYRIINYHTCHCCWNDMRENCDHFDSRWCPRHKGTDRHFECTRLISAEQVITTIKKIQHIQLEAAQ